MSGTDFNKTPSMLKLEIEASIEQLHRQLTISQGQAEKGSSSLLNAVLVAFVLIGQLLFMNLFDVSSGTPGTPSEAKSTEPESFALSARDRKILDTLMTRVDEGVDAIQTTKARVSPSMQIDTHLSSIKSAAHDTKIILGLEMPVVPNQKQ
ncbi:MAG: hypothetical protein AABY81_06815 [Pseudomonadota bacterium]